jgi:hypothetical protein
MVLMFKLIVENPFFLIKKRNEEIYRKFAGMKVV